MTDDLLQHGIVSRRGFLRTAGALGVLASLERLTPAYARPLTGLIAPPGRAAVTPEGTRLVDLVVRETSVGIGRRRATATAINDTVPGPLLRFREGDDVTIRVRNALREDTSIHWHGLLVPNAMDGVPDVNFPGIRAGETFTYRFPIRQYGTYWYHSHSGLQEQVGHYGPLILDPREPEPFQYDREYVVMLSDWPFEDPYEILDNLKKQSTYYNSQRRTVGEFFRDVDRMGLRPTIRERLAWARMRMSPTDISDVMAPAYTYLVNGLPPDSNWTGLFRPGERVRLRFINAAAGSFFDVRIPGLPMTVVAVSGQYVQPVETDEFRIENAQTFDVIVQPTEDRAYTLFAESMDRSGYARGTLAPRAGMSAPVPDRRPRPTLSMMDMGMTGMGGGDMSHMSGMAGSSPAPGTGSDMAGMGAASASGGAEGQLPDGTIVRTSGLRAPGTLPDAVMHGPDSHGAGNAATPMQTQSRLAEPGAGLGNDGWRVLVYTDLKRLAAAPDFGPPVREFELHLTGNMERYMWSINGIKFSDAPGHIPLRLGERIRLTIVNDTMMAHPMHLHGMFMTLENGHGAECPLVHTINVKPAERVSLLATPADPGPWAFHCHILFHMELGMFRVFHVAGAGESLTAADGRQ
ncbi:MAG TPA: copper resistance system multicopper oxidase [Gemmatimonadaceae bacterium]|nr:copper resistance system multicopper oxidase [Gemmatimonadaceae bacterium]